MRVQNGRHVVATLSLLAVVCASTQSLAAQSGATSTSLTVGTRVKLQSADLQRVTTGRLVRMDDAYLVLKPDTDASDVRVSRSSITQLWVSEGTPGAWPRRKRFLLWGGGIGAALSVIGGATASQSCTPSDDYLESFFDDACKPITIGDRAIIAGLLSGLLVPVGTGVGALFSRGTPAEQWREERVAIHSPTLLRGQTGVGVSVRW